MRTELKEAEVGGAFCYSFSAKAGSDWYDIAGGLFTENAITEDEMEKVMGKPVDGKIFFLRGDVTPGFVGKSMKVERKDNYFVGFWAGKNIILIFYLQN